MGFLNFLKENEDDTRVDSYLEINDIEMADVMEYVVSGDFIDRVIWGKISNEIKIPKVSSLGLPEGDGIYAIHVTAEPEYWIPRLEKDYDRDTKNAVTINIKLADGDVLIDDHQYKFDPETNDKASSYILLTTRSILRKNVDFNVG